MTKIWYYLILFLVGVGIGVGGTMTAPDYLSPYLPDMIRGDTEIVEGVVTAKERKRAWLLITVNTPQGAILSTFKNKVDEIELLVEEGDAIELSLHQYEPFVEDPAIKRVRKGVTPWEMRGRKENLLPQRDNKAPLTLPGKKKHQSFTPKTTAPLTSPVKPGIKEPADRGVEKGGPAQPAGKETKKEGKTKETGDKESTPEEDTKREETDVQKKDNREKTL